MELVRYFFAGLTALAADGIVYFGLSFYLSLSAAKGISFVAGSTVAFLLNKYWTFDQKKRSLSEVLRFVLLYLSTIALNMGVNALLLYNGTTILTAYFGAASSSTILNYIGQKWWVFKKARSKKIAEIPSMHI